MNAMKEPNVHPRTCQLGLASDGSKKMREYFNLGLSKAAKSNEGRKLDIYNGVKTQKVESQRPKYKLKETHKDYKNRPC